MKARNLQRTLALSATLLLSAAGLSGPLLSVSPAQAAVSTQASTESGQTAPAPSATKSATASDSAGEAAPPSSTPQTPADRRKSDSEVPGVGTHDVEVGSVGGDEDPSSDSNSCAKVEHDPTGLALAGPENDQYTVSVDDGSEAAKDYPDDLNGCTFTIPVSNRPNDPLQVMVGHKEKPEPTDEPAKPPRFTAMAQDGEIPRNAKSYRLNSPDGKAILAKDYEIEKKADGSFSALDKHQTASPAPEPTEPSTPEPSKTDDANSPHPTTPAPEPSESPDPSEPTEEPSDPVPAPDDPNKPDENQPPATPKPTPSDDGPADPNNGNGSGSLPSQDERSGDTDDYSDPVPRGTDAADNPDAIKDPQSSEQPGQGSQPSETSTRTQASNGQLTSGLGPVPWSIAAIVGLGIVAVLLAFLVLGRRKKDQEH